MEEKVYLRIETPFSLKHPKTRSMALYVVFVLVAMMAVVAVLCSTPENQDLAKRMAVFFAIWFAVGAVPCALMIFNGYVKIVDGDLVCNKFGFFEKRYPRERIEKAVRTGNTIQIFSEGKVIVTLPNNGPARHLISSLRLRL